MLPTMCLRATCLQSFKICHSVELNNFIEAKALGNPYDYCKAVIVQLPPYGGHTENSTWVISSLQAKCKLGISENRFIDLIK